MRHRGSPLRKLHAASKPVKQTWSQPTIKGTPPAPRDSHSCTNVGDNLFVFGGTDGMNTLKDLHILDTSSHTWISPSIRGEGPEAREGHSAALVGKRLFIFGGCGKSLDDDEEVYYNDLFILNTGANLATNLKRQKQEYEAIISSSETDLHENEAESKWQELKDGH
ncbi:hypothetical protein NL676_009522 [Syzygium grande]|nr:hypothetical protein NL676_009522 [Syzygium grande]